MKQLLTLFALASAVLISGCTAITPEAPQETALQPMTFSASVTDEPVAPKEPAMRTAIDGLDVTWSEGDRIGIYDGTAFRIFTLEEGAGETSAVFKGEAAEAESYTAVYPYNENLAINSDGKITGLSIPRFQTAGDCPVIMTAKCEKDSLAFEFRHALAYAKFTPEFDCNKVVLETYGKTNFQDYPRDLCGDIVLARDDDYNRYWSDYRDIMLARVTANASNHIILSGEIKAEVPCLIAVAPKVLDMGFKFILDASDDNLQYSKKFYKRPVSGFMRGHILNFGTFDKKTTAWTESGTVLAFCDSGMNEPSSGRAIYDRKDFEHIEAYCRATGSSETIVLQIVEDIDYNGDILLPSVFDIAEGCIIIYGNGHKITNYVQGGMNVNDTGCAGLFVVADLGRLTFNGLNLYPKAFNISGGDSPCYVGAFVAKAHCTKSLFFDKCHVYGDISINCKGDAYAGGFCGMFELPGEEENSYDVNLLCDCLMEGKVTARSSDDDACAGGFVGLIDAPDNDFECYVENCRNRAAILAEGHDDSYAGGIIGYDRDNTTGGDVALDVTSCVNEGSVTASALDEDDTYAGGIIGYHNSDGTSRYDNPIETSPSVNNCLNRGTITSKGGKGWFNTGLAGGIAGYCYDDDTTFSNCVDDGELSTDDKCAHISGSSGSYGNPCFWTKGENHYGIYKKEDKGGYNPGVTAGDLNAAGFDARWITRDGHLDINIILQ